MTMTPEQAAWFQGTFTRLVDNVDQAVMGKREVVGLVLAAMLAEGHVLLEDAPGTGKTSLAKALAATVQGTSSRIQFTPDLLPSDVTGVTIYDQAQHRFEFHRGPVFASIVLADEINRASPKTQSALLEVMEESRVTVDGTPHAVGRPFLVIATQNPIEQAGTYKLPEAQLDRFLIKTSIGYPDLAVAERILAGAVRPQPVGPAVRAHHDRRGRRHGGPRGDGPRRTGRAALHRAAGRGDARRRRDPPGRLGARLARDDPHRQGLGGLARPSLRHSRRHQAPRAPGLDAPPRPRPRGRVLGHDGRHRASRAFSRASPRRRRGPWPDGDRDVRAGRSRTGAAARGGRMPRVTRHPSSCDACATSSASSVPPPGCSSPPPSSSGSAGSRSAGRS